MKRKTYLCCLLLIFTLFLCSCSFLKDFAKSNTADETDVISADALSDVDVVPCVFNVSVMNDITSAGLVKMKDDSKIATDSDFVFDFYTDTDRAALANRLNDGEIDIAAVPMDVAEYLHGMLPEKITVLCVNAVYVLKSVVVTDEEVKVQEALEVSENLRAAGVIVTTKEFAENNPKAVSEFLKLAKTSVDFAEENKEKAAVLMEEHGFTISEVSETPYSDLKFAFFDGEALNELLV